MRLSACRATEARCAALCGQRLATLPAGQAYPSGGSRLGAVSVLALLSSLRAKVVAFGAFLQACRTESLISTSWTGPNDPTRLFRVRHPLREGALPVRYQHQPILWPQDAARLRRASPRTPRDKIAVIILDFPGVVVSFVASVPHRLNPIKSNSVSVTGCQRNVKCRHGIGAEFVVSR